MFWFLAKRRRLTNSFQVPDFLPLDPSYPCSRRVLASPAWRPSRCSPGWGLCRQCCRRPGYLRPRRPPKLRRMAAACWSRPWKWTLRPIRSFRSRLMNWILAKQSLVRCPSSLNLTATVIPVLGLKLNPLCHDSILELILSRCLKYWSHLQSVVIMSWLPSWCFVAFCCWVCD